MVVSYSLWERKRKGTRWESTAYLLTARSTRYPPLG